LAEPFVDGVEAVQRLVDRNDLVELHLERGVAVPEGHTRRDAAPFGGAPPAGEVDEHLAHRPRSGTEEVCLALPSLPVVRAELEERFMNELRRRERRPSVGATPMGARHPFQLVIDAVV
jgi:hypothetical protein